MKKNKFTVIALSFVFAAVCAFCFTACENTGSGNGGKTPEAHKHVWSNWAVSAQNVPTASKEGKAERKCSGTGECDATAADKEYTLPVTGSEDYTVGPNTATCKKAGKVTYTYAKNDVNVSFDVATEINPEAHSWGSGYTYDDASGHYKVCANDASHKTTTEAHDSDGILSACTKCGYTATVNALTDSAPNAVNATSEGTAYAYTAPYEGSFTLECDDAAAVIYEYRDGEKQPVTLPYNVKLGAQNKVTFIMSCTGESASYNVSIAAMQVFTVTVLTPDGNGAEGAKVAIKDEADAVYSGVTAESGTVKIEAAPLSGSSAYSVVLTEQFGTYMFGKVVISAATPSVTVQLGEPIEGGNEYGAAEITAPGIYSAVVDSTNDWYGGVSVAEKYFAYTATEAGTYTFTLLDDGALASIGNEGSYDPIDKRGSASVILEEGESIEFLLTTDDSNVTADYRQPAVFGFSKSAPPELGAYSRPVRIRFDTPETVNSSNKKVYFKLDCDYETQKATVTAAEGTAVYWLGVSLSDTAEGTAVSSGSVQEVAQWSATYFYAIGDGNVSVTVSPYYAPGTNKNPIEAKYNQDNNVELDLENGIFEVWFKAEVTEDGDYIAVPDDNYATLSVYNSVDEYTAVIDGQTGVPVVLQLKADTPLYIKATNNNNESYSFNLRPVTNDDTGTAAGVPTVVTGGSSYALRTDSTDEGKYTYFAVTVSNGSNVTINYTAPTEAPTHKVYIYVFDNINLSYDGYVTSETAYDMAAGGSLTVSQDATDDTTYYFYVQLANLAQSFNPEISVAVGSYTVHDYQISVKMPDESAAAQVTVKLCDGSTVVDTQTTDDSGNVTFANVDPKKDYTLTLENLPASYGYYDSDVTIKKNTDATTTHTVTLTAFTAYGVKITLPDGTAAADIAVTFTADGADPVEGETNSEGEYSFSCLPLANNGKYSVEVTLTEQLLETYYTPMAAECAAATVTNIVLKEYFTATIKVTDGSGADLSSEALSKLTVNINGTDYTPTADGTVTLAKADPVTQYEITVGKAYYYSNTIRISEDDKDNVVIRCAYIGENGLIEPSSYPSGAAALGSGDNLIDTSSGGYYVKYTATEAGTYRITFKAEFGSNALSTNYSTCEIGINDITVVDTTWGDTDSRITVVQSGGDFIMFIYSFDATLAEGDSLTIKINGYGEDTTVICVEAVTE